MKVLSVFGTRPEAIKMLPLVKEMSQNKEIISVVCVTAQHREMLDQVLDSFQVVPDYDLNLMKSKQTPTSITADVLNALEKVMEQEKPELVLVHGDTTTSFAAALAAFYQKIPVGHVEAGLRTGDRYSPFPEEMNRNLTSRLATLHFAPTAVNVENLKIENVRKYVYQTGNTVIDALRLNLREDYLFKNAELNKIVEKKERIILFTAHRRENMGQPLQQIFAAVSEIAEQFSDVQIVYPVHRNPVIMQLAEQCFSTTSNIHLVEPLEVMDMHNLMNCAELVLTDSGGIQEEAPTLGKPVLVLRTETERPEAVSAGGVRVVGVETADIVKEVKLLLCDNNEYGKMSRATNPYGDGYASKRICEAILEYFSDEGSVRG